MHDLFASLQHNEQIGTGAFIFRKAGLSLKERILRDLIVISDQAPFRHMITPGGRTMNVEMTNCGLWGWVSDQKRGYRYQKIDPLTGKYWPYMPPVWEEFAHRMAQKAGYTDFFPQGCLINHYSVGHKMGLHQDRDEKDLAHPIVSLSLGDEAVFQFGGSQRTDPIKYLRLSEGDVVVWGGQSRLCYHGISKIIPDSVQQSRGRYSLTFRCI